MHNPLEAVPVFVALISNSEVRGKRLQALLRVHGVDVRLYTDLAGELLSRIKATPAAAVIVDLDGGGERERRLIDELTAQDDVPLLFNDGTSLDGRAPVSQQALAEQFANKILSLVGAPSAAPYQPATNGGLAGLDEGDAGSGPAPYASIDNVVYAGAAAQPARQVWVLGASLGGPEAVRRFIGRVPVDLPAAFILAQRIGVECIPMLRDQLRRVTSLTVMSARPGHLLQHGDFVIAPMDRYLDFDPDGCLQFGAPDDDEDAPPPSIDSVMAAVARRFGERAGGIIFSGIGNDGVLGARLLLERGGTVWAQAADSCVMSSMPDHVRNACPIDFNASPESLAERLIHHVTERHGAVPLSSTPLR